MKKTFVQTVAFFLLMASCSKTPTTSPDGDKGNQPYLLSFTIDGFSQELLPFPDNKLAAVQRSPAQPLQANAVTSTTDIRDFINVLEIKVYDGGTLLDSTRQYADNPEFGAYKKYLTPMPESRQNGYNVYIVGAMLENNEDIELNKVPGQQSNAVKLLSGTFDSFYLYTQVKVRKEAMTPLSLKLKRFVGRLEVNIIDEIPIDAHRIEVTIHNTGQYFLPATDRGYAYTPDESLDTELYKTEKSVILSPEDIGITDYSFDAYFIAKNKLGSGSATSDITISAYNEEGVLLQQRTIPNVAIEGNKRTKLTGRLFTTKNAEFEVEILPEWGLDLPEYEF